MHLFLLPGLDGTGLLFTPLLATLSPQITTTVIAYPPDQLLDYDALLAYIQSQLPTTEPYIVVAESFSGPLAIRLANQPAPNLQALVLCATFVTAPLPALGRMIVRMARHFLFRFRPPAFAVRYFLLGFEAAPALLEQFYAAVRLVVPTVLAERMRMVLEVDQQTALAQLTLPILVLVATKDRLIPQTYSVENFGPQKNVQVEFVDSPHLLLQTKPSEAMHKIFQWLNVKSLQNHDYPTRY